VTIHELLHTEKFGGRKWPGEVLRLAMLRTHYRQPIDWTVKALEEAEKTLDDWYKKVESIETDKAEIQLDPDFAEALCDDLNFPKAVSILHSLYHKAGPPLAGKEQIDAKYRFKKAAHLLGLLQGRTSDWFEQRTPIEIDKQDIEKLISARLAARAAKNWAESDRIRDELAAMGIALKDNKDGTTTWEVKR
jgi:cysteinyl-tRNA synthetase